jgi:hypothetical protein
MMSPTSESIELVSVVAAVEDASMLVSRGKAELAGRTPSKAVAQSKSCTFCAQLLLVATRR